MQDELNQYGIFLSDLYILDYYGIKIFFQVCKTTKESVFLVELASKKNKYGIMLTKRLKTAKNPLIVLNNNTRTKSEYEVKPIKLHDEYWLPIKIDYNDPLYLKAKQYCEYPSYGYAYAVPLKEYLNKYWTENTQNEQQIDVACWC